MFFSDVDDWEVVLFEDANSLTGGIAILVRPGQSAQLLSNFFNSSGRAPIGSGRAGIGLQVQRADGKFTLLSLFGGTTLQASQIQFNIGGQISSGKPEIFGELNMKGGQFTVGLGSADGFISSLTGGKPIQVNFDLGISYSQSQGLRITGGGGFALTLAVNLTIGPITLSSITLRFDIGGGGVTLEVSASFDAELGPITASAERIGLLSDLAFQEGNVGPADLSLDFKPPSGIGIAIDAGPVSGGGFIFFDPDAGRYFGALELSIYSVSVKAFGVIDTKLPTGPGYSFLIIISAEFTPIQLGFGFTLNGVGGLIGINRSVDSNGLLTMIKTGQLDNVLFPDDVVDNAPAILNDIETLFPPTKGHYVFGPMAKIGWAALVDGELGLIIEYPGPVLTVIGTVHAALPTKDEAVVELNLDVGGVLDFPNKKFSLDASRAPSCSEERIARVRLRAGSAIFPNHGGESGCRFHAMERAALILQDPGGKPQYRRFAVRG